METCKRFNGILIACQLSLVALSQIALGEQLSPPPYDIQNRHKVNLASGEVSPMQTDLSIGGSMGLSHTISTYTSNFVNIESGGAWGYKEKYSGGVYKTRHHQKSAIVPDELWVLRAYDNSSTTDFIINSDGNTFTSLSDSRYSLEYVINPSYKLGFRGFVYRKPDGAAVYYEDYLATDHDYRGNKDPVHPAMTDIEYPNGLRIHIDHKGVGQWASVASVTSNTGFQLKYIYVKNTTGYQDPEPSNTWIPAQNPLNWSSLMPKYIVAINNGFDYCTAAPNDYAQTWTSACANINQWPKVTYDWPNGMPRVMYTGPSVFKVTDAAGRTSEYHHSPYSSYIPNVQTNKNIKVPRIVSIKESANQAEEVHYDYKTEDEIVGFDWAPIYAAGPIAKISRSWIGNDSIGYRIGFNSQPYPQVQGFSGNSGGGGGYHPMEVISHSVYGVHQVLAWNQRVYLGIDYANRVYKIEKLIGGGEITFRYDARGNVTEKTEDGVTTYAEYPSSCTSSNRKYCNQASWIKDANGNQTDYTYDANSGQVTKITYPADTHGIRPETRYSYTALYAYYKQSVSGAPTRAATPIYLLTRESKCQKTAASGTGCSGGAADEIVTVYDYGPQTDGVANNLLLRGVTVTAANSDGNLESRKTCYAYDKYANQIGETKPKANLSACY